jgi:hypothetical protein
VLIEEPIEEKQRRREMASWEESIDRGVAKAKQEGKLVLVDFFNPQ